MVDLWHSMVCRVRMADGKVFLRLGGVCIYLVGRWSVPTYTNVPKQYSTLPYSLATVNGPCSLTTIVGYYASFQEYRFLNKCYLTTVGSPLSCNGQWSPFPCNDFQFLC